jgi:hypothetical protein
VKINVYFIVYFMGEGEVYTVFCVGKTDGKTFLGRPRPRWKGSINMDLQKWDVGVWTGLIWLRIGTGDGHL